MFLNVPARAKQASKKFKGDEKMPNSKLHLVRLIYGHWFLQRMFFVYSFLKCLTLSGWLYSIYRLLMKIAVAFQVPRKVGIVV